MSAASAIVAGRAYITVGVKGIQQSSSKLTNMMQSMNGKLGAIKAFAGITAAGAVLSGVAKAAKLAADAIVFAFNYARGQVIHSIEEISNVVKQSDRLGVDVSWMSQMRVVAADSNASMNELEQSFAAFQRNIATASNTGRGEAADTLDMLGLDPTALKNAGIPQAIEDVTRALGRIPEGSARGGAAMAIFGEQGRKLLPMLIGNVDLMQSLREQSDFLGTTMENDGARGVDNLRDSYKKLQMQIAAIWEAFTMKIAPAISSLIDGQIIPFVHVMQQLIGGFDDGGMAATSFSGFVGILANVFKQLMLAAVAQLGMMAKSVEQLLKWGADLLEVYSDVQEFLSGSRSSAADIVGTKLDDYAESIGGSSGHISDWVHSFDQNFADAQKEWADLVQRERDATVRGIGEPAEDIGNAVDKLSDVFKGEAMGRNAATMQRMQEWHQKNSKDIKEYVKRIAGLLNTAPLVRAVP